MKKITIYILISTFFLTACKKEEIILPQIKQPVSSVDSTKPTKSAKIKIKKRNKLKK